MLIKTLALAAALAVGAATMAQAENDREDTVNGGYRIGPMGQVFGGRPFARMPRAYYGFAYARHTFAYAPRHHHRIWVD
jgi:hypothetical protein